MKTEKIKSVVIVLHLFNTYYQVSATHGPVWAKQSSVNCEKSAHASFHDFRRRKGLYYVCDVTKWLSLADLKKKLFWESGLVL